MERAISTPSSSSPLSIPANARFRWRRSRSCARAASGRLGPTSASCATTSISTCVATGHPATDAASIAFSDLPGSCRCLSGWATKPTLFFCPRTGRMYRSERQNLPVPPIRKIRKKKREILPPFPPFRRPARATFLLRVAYPLPHRQERVRRAASVLRNSPGGGIFFHAPKGLKRRKVGRWLNGRGFTP